MAKQQYIDDLFNSLSSLKKLIESQRQESVEEKAATMMHYSALTFLQNNKQNTVGDLATHLRLSKSSATQLIERLEKSNFVTRAIDSVDRRQIRVEITPEGKEKLTDFKKKFKEKIVKLFSHVPENDLKELARIHSDLIKTLEKKQKEKKL